jgi:hypothetical protein
MTTEETARAGTSHVRITPWAQAYPPLASALAERLRAEGLSVCDVSMPTGVGEPFRPARRGETVWLAGGWMRVRTRAGGGAASEVVVLRPGDRADFEAGSERALESVGEDAAHFVHGRELGRTG